MKEPASVIFEQLKSSFVTMTYGKVVAIFMIVSIAVVSSQKPSYKICVPAIVLPACNELMNKKSELATIECVAGRDRVDCLDIVERRDADFMAVDPEDLYLALKKKNEDYSVFSDIRTKEEEQAEFRYEGIILVKKNSGINSLADLRGKKSCHTGFGRNVGYKIPITKLKKHNIFKVDPDTSLPPVERELKALSELFTQSCLVGKYSSNPDVNLKLKKSYPNLCALCADPVKCDYPDRFSGYDGSILCLAENGGDVAFTKVIYVRKYFGLPIGHATKSLTEAQANPNDYEYLCEDGSKVPITGKACTWAQRPWQAYMGNGDINQKQLDRLQRRLSVFYDDAKTADHQNFAKQMLVNEKNTVVAKEVPILPGDHLSKAKYTDVIERQLLDGNSDDEKIKLCVTSNIALKKCLVMRDVAYSRDIRPSFECVMKDAVQCSGALKAGEVDAIVVQSHNIGAFNLEGLKPILFEAFDDTDKYVVIGDQDITFNDLKKATLKFDPSNTRSVDAALGFSEKRRAENERVCPNNIKNNENGKLQVVNSKDLSKYSTDKVLVCPNLKTKSLSEYKTCNFDLTMPGAVYVNNALNSNKLDGIKHSFTALSDKFGHTKPLEDVFEMFGEFEKGEHDVLFDDNATSFSTEQSGSDAKTYKKLRCLD